MAYSGADVLTQLSELARQRAAMPVVTSIMVVSQNRAEGDLVQSALRAVVGYDTRIMVSSSHAEAVRDAKTVTPQIGFCVDDGTNAHYDGAASLRALRAAGISCPVAIIRGEVTPQIKNRLIEIGATDVLNRDDVCGIRLREGLLRLLVRQTLNDKGLA